MATFWKENKKGKKGRGREKEGGKEGEEERKDQVEKAELW